MNRQPPKLVRQELRREVGFGCPVDGCGNPYLRWHHFDPPWREREHHEPKGMIALCAEHHDKADSGAFTGAQLRALKDKDGDDREVSGRFDWMREKLLAIVGGNAYYEVPTPLEIGGKKVVWFNRDEQERFLLNVEMPARSSGQPRLRIEDNDWIETGEPDDLECPPKGTLVAATYRNGDVIRVEFSEAADVDALSNKYPFLPFLPAHGQDFDFPLAVVEIRLGVTGSVLDLGPRGTRVLVPGITMTGCYAAHCGVGLSLG